MRDKNFKEIMINVVLFAFLFSFSLWKEGFLSTFLPGLAILLLAHLSIELANGLDNFFRILLYILGILLYPLSFDFFRYLLAPSLLNGLLQFILYLYFLRLHLCFQKSLLHSAKLNRTRHIYKILLAIFFGLIASLIQLDKNSLFLLIQNLSLEYGKNLFHSFSLELAVFFFLIQIIFLYLVDLLINNILFKK